MALSELVGNKFWDNSDPKGESNGYILKTDKRSEFFNEFSKWSAKYCTKNTKWQCQHLGLFGTARGIKLTMKTGNIKRDSGFSFTTLVKKFGEENNIPVYVSGHKVFSNIYSMVDEEESMSSYHNSYSTRIIDAYQEVYGKPMYVKQDPIGLFSDFLSPYKNYEYVSVFNYNYVGYLFYKVDYFKRAIKETGLDFDVIKEKEDEIYIQVDDYDLLRQFELKIKQLKDADKRG